jgi:uncharacterized membrane protein YoaK (UPF0700 family)
MPDDWRLRLQPVRLVALTIGAAATDALSYLGLGHVFPANMTGNTVLLGLGVATGDYAGAYRASTALGAYVIAAFCFGMFTAADSSAWRLRLGLAVEFGILLSAGIWWLSLGSAPHARTEYGRIMLVGAAMGIQSSITRKLKLPGVTTTYITGTWTTLANSLGGRLRLRGRYPNAPAEQYAQLTVVATYILAALVAAAAYVAWHAYAALIPAAAIAVALGLPNQNEPGQDGYERASGSRSGDGAEERQQTSEGGDLMSQWSEGIQKAEQLAKDHPQQADEALQKGEQFAEQETGHRFDQQIGTAGQQAEQRFGGGQQSGQGAQQDPQNQGQQDQGQQDQGQQDQQQDPQNQG